MNTKVYVVTGITSGLGKAIALALAKTGETVVLVARDADRGAQVVKDISFATQNPNLDLQLCDLASLSSVRNLATIINNRYEKIDVLINNASVYKRDRETTIDGYETMFATNHLGPFLLTYLLMDKLLASGSARIINITAPSTTQLNFDDLQSEKNFNPLTAFGASKMANLLFTYELARHMENRGTRVNAVNPGLMRTSMAKEAPAPLRLIRWLFSSSPNSAAEDIVKLATAQEFADTHGKFLRKGKEVEATEYALNPAIGLKLWEISEQLTKAPEQGPNYDPTGSIAMFNDKDIPEGLIRPEEEPTQKE
jgi:NAD(P)-dependent dehydrogenase (short-subunit alcohol dehydrogenase family)